MLCCDFCDMWYHYTCIGLPQDLKLLEKIKYKCIGCAIRQGLFTITNAERRHGNSAQALPNEANDNGNANSSFLSGCSDTGLGLSIEGCGGLYVPVMPNRMQVLKDLKEIESSPDAALFPNQFVSPEIPLEQQVYQQEIEKVLLEHFLTKGRVQFE